MNEYTMIIRLVIALFLGALIGIERVHAGKSAGIRTLGLVSLGSALFIVVSELVLNSYGAVDADPLRVAAQIVTGIGFLGAGMIIFKGNHISNLTTAAGVWVAAAIGVTTGFGFYTLAVVVTLLVMITFNIMLHLEIFLKKKIGQTIEQALEKTKN